MDPGDKYDSMKWDFDETHIPVFIVGNYAYKAKNAANARKLAQIRQKISLLCKRLVDNKHVWSASPSAENVKLFLELHSENEYDPYHLPIPRAFFNPKQLKKTIVTSRYLLSEIPQGTLFDGLNKPRMRYEDMSAPFIGKDENRRALYRDIFLNLNKPQSQLDSLVIHELAHSMANHIYWRSDDHNCDFDFAEALITQYWPMS